ncbi:ECs_2282 family putative zinc-binding protein [Kosakonia sacchari]|uniref:ECs_2282 family putative zinc-binding protein n=1 Tax=Kosakonia sacchari TaxID=1158459 RepID=UPI003A1006AA
MTTIPVCCPKCGEHLTDVNTRVNNPKQIHGSICKNCLGIITRDEVIAEAQRYATEVIRKFFGQTI